MQRQRRPWRRILIGGIAALLFLQALNILMPDRIRPVGPFNLIARAIISTAAVVDNLGSALSHQYDKYLDNADGVERAYVLEAENERLRFERDWAIDFIKSRQIIDEMSGWTFLPWQGVQGRIVYHDPVERYSTAWMVVPDGADVMNHAVATSKGLVGRVIGQAGSSVQILLINDVESAVDTITEKGVRVIVRGTGGERGRVEFVPKYEMLDAGDVLVTTGRDRTYPAGISVAVVGEVKRESEQLYLSAPVYFVVDVARADWVRALPPGTR